MVGLHLPPVVGALVHGPAVGDARGMRGQLAQGDGFVGERGVGHLERQVGVDVLVQRQLSLLHGLHQGDASEGLADGGDVHRRVRGERHAGLLVGVSVTPGPDQLPVDDDGCARTDQPGFFQVGFNAAVNGIAAGRGRLVECVRGHHLANNAKHGEQGGSSPGRDEAHDRPHGRLKC